MSKAIAMFLQKAWGIRNAYNAACPSDLPAFAHFSSAPPNHRLLYVR